MCFSAEMDLVAGTAVTALGIDALRHINSRRDLPLALLPVVLGGHLLVEAAVWRGLQGDGTLLGWRAATTIYLAIAFVVVPMLVPLAVVIREPKRRRRQLTPFVVVGIAVGVILGRFLWDGPVAARVNGHHVAYHVPLTSGGLIVAAYVAATCGPALLSTDRAIRAFGWANLLAVAILVGFEKAALISLWCAWAAVASAAIVVKFRHRTLHQAPPLGLDEQQLV
ncbi:MAG: DUF6629 family protein [Aquihabitans sp.]